VLVVEFRFPDDVVRTDLFVPPPICVCCGAPSTTVRQQNVRGLSGKLDFPYCEHCAKHEEAARHQMAWGCLALLAAAWVLPAMLGERLGGPVLIGLIAIGTWLLVRIMNDSFNRKASLLRSQCSATKTDAPVRIKDHPNGPLILEFRNDTVGNAWRTHLLATKIVKSIMLDIRP
jgi:hypothetical protein